MADDTALPDIPGFTIERKIGAGDYGDVYLALDDDGVQLVLKVLRVTGGDPLERLKSEAAALHRFDHRSIPTLVSNGSESEIPYVAMSLAPGQSLRERINNNSERNSRFSDLEALLVGAEVLDALQYIHTLDATEGQGWVHRDIKDANVMVSDSLDRISLIDFGFCKEDRADDRRLSDSFFRAGAARYSPPSKLHSPSTARATHDVFAVGVLMYQMLTNSFPWNVEIGSVGHLSDSMEKDRPHPANALNSTVRREVSDFIDQLICVDDLKRPTAGDALAQCRRLIDTLSSTASSTIGRSSAPIKYPRVWRDPLYGDVRLTEYEMSLIDSPEMQRLRGMMQLGLTYLVFDGARHSRLSHSVGSLFRVESILSEVERIEGVRVDHDTRLAARLYALVHDVTHIPIGHTLEDEYGLFYRHDRNGDRIRRLVFGNDPGSLGAMLTATEWGREIRKQFDPDSTVHGRSDISELVSGPVGADVLDYVNRDAYFCGLDHRVDSALLRQIRVRDGRLDSERHVMSLVKGSYGIRIDREYALEALYDERYAMFLKVYAHKTKLKASALLAKALGLALTAGKKPAMTEQEIEQMSDSGLIDAIATRRRSNEREVHLIKQLRARRLPRAVYRSSLLPPAERDEGSYVARQRELCADGPLGLFPLERRFEVEESLAKSAGLKPDQVFVYAAGSAPGYKKTQRHKLVDEHGNTSSPSSLWFNRLKERHLGLWDLWVLVDIDAEQDAGAKLGHAAQDRFGLPNQVSLPVRQGLLF